MWSGLQCVCPGSPSEVMPSSPFFSVLLFFALLYCISSSPSSSSFALLVLLVSVWIGGAEMPARGLMGHLVWLVVVASTHLVPMMMARWERAAHLNIFLPPHSPSPSATDCR